MLKKALADNNPISPPVLPLAYEEEWTFGMANLIPEGSPPSIVDDAAVQKQCPADYSEFLTKSGMSSLTDF